VALLPPPDEGMFAVPRVHVLQAQTAAHDHLGDSAAYDPSSQCSAWSENFDPASGRHYYSHQHTGTWQKWNTPLEQTPLPSHLRF
jgi:hypothetical protein